MPLTQIRHFIKIIKNHSVNAVAAAFYMINQTLSLFFNQGGYMRTETLKYLLEVDKLQSISKAATNLFISQSALSESISALEKELNVAIFTRTRKGIIPTESGKKIIAQAKKILEEIDKLYLLSYEAPPLVDYTESLSFSLSEKHAETCLNDCLSCIMHKYPNLTLHTFNMGLFRSIEALCQQEIQFAIVSFPSALKDEIQKLLHDNKLALIVLSSESIDCLAHKDSPLSQKNVITAKDYSPFTLITYSDVTPEKYFNDQKVYFLSALKNILKLLCDNVGFTLLPHSMTKELPEEIWECLAAVPVIDSFQYNYIIYSSERSLTEAQQYFINLYKIFFTAN